MKRWPAPQEFINADQREVMQLIIPLGFMSRRSTALLKMTERFIAGPWRDARELPGIGEYGARSFEIFCEGKLGDEPPKDHALVKYWHWAKERNEQRK